MPPTPATMEEKSPLLSDPSASHAQAEEDAQTPQPSLSELQQNVFAAQRAYMRAWSRTTSGKLHRRIMFTVSALLFSFFVFMCVLVAQDAGGEFETGNGKAKLEAHIMSKCPDARDCLHDLILPVMQRVGDKVDFHLEFIGNSTTHDDGVSCLHGPTECLGNIIELCTAKLYPSPRLYLGFTMCISKQYTEIPSRSLLEDCALEHGLDFEKINRCAVDEDGALSVDLLKKSFARSKEAGVTRSCTVRLNGETRCVRDGGEWKDCEKGSKVEDLVRDIVEVTGGEDAYWY